MPNDTHNEIKAVKDDTNSKFETLNRNLNQGFKAVSDAVKETNEKINHTNIEVAKISTKMEAMVDEPLLIKTVNDSIDKHEIKKHKSNPPKLSSFPNQNGSIKINIPLKVGGVVLGGGAVFYVVWDLVIKALIEYFSNPM